MNLRNVKLIWSRELRDQLRDRRTLFMVVVLPMLMYPLLGASFFQLSQFLRQHTGRVLVAGVEQLEEAPGNPPLLDGDRFHAELFERGEDAKRLVVERIGPDEAIANGRARMAAGEADVLLFFPDDFAARLQSLRDGAADDAIDPPKPLVLYNSAREKSQVAQLRVERVLQHWRQLIVRENLRVRDLPMQAAQPITIDRHDIAEAGARDARLWAKLLPFIAFVWALTGAFYPAIDLCAGEKERGTLETLLSSPTRRSEVVGGKLLTVMTFSFVTSLLNLAGMLVTARLILSQLNTAGALGAGALSPPPVTSLVWLLLAMIPMVALFSALSLACAAYARSTKEGQYYFMPLFLGAMPLMLLPMSPGIELNLGNSLVPVMGLVLLLRAALEGSGAQALIHAPPAMVTTGICVWLATRWAVSQFNQESVLFRDSERLDLRGWFAATFRRRQETTTAAAAVACAAAIFILQFLFQQVLTAWPPEQLSFEYFAATVLGGQLLCIAAPALAVVLLFTRDRWKSLLLDKWPSLATLATAAGLAIALHPVGQWLSLWIQQTYPLSEQVAEQATTMMSLIGESPSFLATLSLLALLPAFCEEIAFRGVLLGGLKKSLGPAAAVVVTAALFGAVHTLLQQSLSAAPLGVVLGAVAILSRNLYACIVFHAIYNALALSLDHFREPLSRILADLGVEQMVFHEIEPDVVCYSPAIAILGALVALALLRGLSRSECGHPHPAAGLQAAPEPA